MASGRQLALMAHFSHPRELETRAVRQAIRRIVATGAVIRCQAPLVRHVNDSADDVGGDVAHADRLGLVPYYMFVERDTGPKHYFEVPLARALRIFNEAYRQVSGLARTVRGPSMSATARQGPGHGRCHRRGREGLRAQVPPGSRPGLGRQGLLRPLRLPGRLVDELDPAFGEAEFFFEHPLREMADGTWRPQWHGDDLAECEGA